jgi:hypothetical protein
MAHKHPLAENYERFFKETLDGKKLNEEFADDTAPKTKPNSAFIASLKKQAAAERKEYKDQFDLSDPETKQGYLENPSIKIDERTPTIAINLSTGAEYYFQGEEASKMLEEIPEGVNISAEDYLLALSLGWG